MKTLCVCHQRGPERLQAPENQRGTPPAISAPPRGGGAGITSRTRPGGNLLVMTTPFMLSLRELECLSVHSLCTLTPVLPCTHTHTHTHAGMHARAQGRWNAYAHTLARAQTRAGTHMHPHTHIFTPARPAQALSSHQDEPQS